MTATFSDVPNEAHNDKSFFFCGTCNAAKIVKTPTPNGPSAEASDRCRLSNVRSARSRS